MSTTRDTDRSTRFPAAPATTVPIDAATAPEHPLELLHAWASVAGCAAGETPIYVCLATASLAGTVSSRMVQLLEIEPSALLMSTNSGSRKGVELDENPRAAISLFWEHLGQSVNLTGTVEFADDDESDRRFAEEPRAVQAARTVSFHGLPLDDEEAQLSSFRELRDGQEPIPRPHYWRWLRLRPDAVTFWEGRPDALNRRLHYQLVDGVWQHTRIQA